MHRIDHPTAIPDLHGPGKPGFTEGDPLIALPPTRVPGVTLNTIQEELACVVEGVGIALDKEDNTQVATAIEMRIDRRVAPQFDAESRRMLSLMHAPALTRWETGVAGSFFPEMIAHDGQGVMWVASSDRFALVIEYGGFWYNNTFNSSGKTPYGCAAWSSDKSRCVFVGEDGFVAQAETSAVSVPMTVTASVSGTTEKLLAVCRGYVGGVARLVAVGENGTIVMGADTAGAAWSPVTSGTAVHLRAVIWRSNKLDGGDGTNGVWVAIGDDGVVRRSVDGLIWTSVTAFTPYALQSIASGSVFVAVAAGGQLWTSGNGLDWAAGAKTNTGGGSDVFGVSGDPDGSVYFVFVRGAVTGWVTVEPNSHLVRMESEMPPDPPLAVACGRNRWVMIHAANRVSLSGWIFR